MNTRKAIHAFAIALAATSVFVGAAEAKAFYYYKYEGGKKICVNSDTNNYPDLNENNFYPAGGWGSCFRIIKPTGNDVKRISGLTVVMNPGTRDVLGLKK
jgi:hypothetical protein